MEYASANSWQQGVQYWDPVPVKEVTSCADSLTNALKSEHAAY